MKKATLIFSLLLFCMATFAQLLAPNGIKIGKKTSTTAVTIDSASVIDGKYRLYKAGTVLEPVNPNSVQFSTVGVYKADTSGTKKGSYTSRYDFKTEPTRHEYIKILNMLGAGIKLSPVMPAGGSYVGSSNQMIDQRASYILAYVQDTVRITALQYQMNSAGSYTVDGTEFNGMALYSTSGTTATRIAITANTATAWTQAANSIATLNLTAPVTLYPGVYYVGFLYNFLVQTTAPYIVGLQPGAVYTGTVLSNNMSLGIFYSAVTQFPASFTISSTQQLGILHNFIGK
jgi:hypothetical protein